MIAAAKKAEPDVNAIASECLSEVGGDYDKAATLLEKRLRKDADLFDWMVVFTARHLIRGIARSSRHMFGNFSEKTNAIVELSGSGGQRSVVGLKNAAASNAASFLDYPLPGGGYLKDADKARLIEAAAFHRVQMRGNQHKHIWFMKLSKLVPKNKTVNDIFSSEKLENLYNQAKDEVG